MSVINQQSDQQDHTDSVDLQDISKAETGPANNSVQDAPLDLTGEQGDPIGGAGLTSGTASFGFKTVPEQDKEKLVKGVFESVARRYDLMNDVMSLGTHRLWKRSLVDQMRPRSGMYHLDVAGGTGDIAFRAIDAEPGLNVTVCDINAEMLGVGKGRAEREGYAPKTQFVCGNAECLPVPDKTYDLYSIAFGIRNVTHIDRALHQARRVLKTGGRAFILEFSPAVLPIIRDIYDAYSFKAIPALGQIFAGDRESYQYLVESIRQFPKPEKLADMMRDAGFDRVGYRTLSAGMVAIHHGWRL